MLFKKFFQTMYVANATYNSFRDQVGFCKMQGYDTISRNTSSGPSLFTSEAVQFGIGLSNNQFDGRLCGMCLEIYQADNLRKPVTNELTNFSSQSVTKFPFIAMVFDQCKDEICVKDESFIDFDVYSPTPPVWKDNPTNVHWRAVECPVYSNKDKIKPLHFIEYLICTPKTCNAQNVFGEGQTIRDIWNPNYFSFTLRNLRIPVTSVQLNDEPLDYVDAFGWTFSGEYISNRSFVFELEAYDGTRLLDIFSFDQIMNLPLQHEYRGGAILHSQHQI